MSKLFNRFTLLAFVAGGALAIGVGASAIGMHHGMMSENMTPAEVQSHVDHGLKHLYVEIDATDAQKAQIGPLVKQAVDDLMPLHQQLRTAHQHAMQALGQSPVDRGALETARAEHLQLADQASKRFVQLIADVDDVLTPAQRKAFIDHVNKLHGVRVQHSSAE